MGCVKSSHLPHSQIITVQPIEEINQGPADKGSIVTEQTVTKELFETDHLEKHNEKGAHPVEGNDQRSIVKEKVKRVDHIDKGIVKDQKPTTWRSYPLTEAEHKRVMDELKEMRRFWRNSKPQYRT